jgi:hypothetical protein
MLITKLNNKNISSFLEKNDIRQALVNKVCQYTEGDELSMKVTLLNVLSKNIECLN